MTHLADLADLDDDRLAAVLASVGEHLVVPTLADPLVRRRQRLAGAVLTAAAAVVVLVLVAVAPVRRTVADWLGIGSTRIEVPALSVPLPGPSSTLPPLVGDLSTLPCATAERGWGRPIPPLRGTRLGEPAGCALMPEGGVLLVWPDGTSLWIRSQHEDTRVVFDKAVASREDVRPVDGIGDGAVFVAGEHIFRTPHRTVEAASVLVWLDGGDEMRLESDLPAEDLIAIAEEIARMISPGG